ncbi:PH domain-containing protein [Corynebacterium heidelbergense]|uniref:Low molecular weight protein antigen 6 PH domain-containing protein n=1 Tax=Corynebacterium heidelbergense TaxID=2055947 RepID=A0A364V8Q2_9CORY|nr:PH domain-containing protein [Corynebacterium heidelbergense]RAV33043.1 hypothetical protein CWC39_10000 [Corynebacterium heidelbergense]
MGQPEQHNTSRSERAEHHSPQGRGEVQPSVFRPSREHILAAGVMFLICLMFTGYNVRWFFWVPLLPLLFIVWIMRVRTHVDNRGITAVTLFRGRKTMPWNEFSAIRFNRGGRAYAAGANDTTMWLPGVTFNSLVELNEKTRGRIPDPVTPARERAENMVQVVNKDGNAVLMDREEYAAYEKQRREEYSATHPTTESKTTTNEK